MLPTIEPVMEALTTSIKPRERAINAMMSSAALPKVALSRPPTPSPARWLKCSVARPIHPANGMTAMAEMKKRSVGLFHSGTSRMATATGTARTAQSSGETNSDRMMERAVGGCFMSSFRPRRCPGRLQYRVSGSSRGTSGDIRSSRVGPRVLR